MKRLRYAIARRGFTLIELLVVVMVIGLLFALLLPSVRRVPAGVAAREHCRNNLKQIALALHQYHDDYQAFPPAFITDENGRPMHSWRVLILPYLDRQTLYEQYRFDEPWDGPHNSKLAERVVAIYNCPSDLKARDVKESTMTNYVVVVGPGTCWPEGKSTRLRDITDAHDGTVLVVEVANSGIHWMEPRDLHVLQMSPTINSPGGQGIASAHKESANVARVDGGVMTMSDKTPATTIRALLTIRGRETISEF